MSHSHPKEYKVVTFLDGAQAITGSFADLGEVINNYGYDNIALFLKIQSNNSTDIQVKIFGKYEKEGDEFELGYKQLKEGVITIEPIVFQFDNTDPEMAFDCDIRGIPFVIIKVKGTGNTPVAGIVSEAKGLFTAR